MSTVDNFGGAHAITCDQGGAISSWKEITLGSYATASALHSALMERRILIGDLAGQMLALPSFYVSSAIARIELIVLSVTQLRLGPRFASFTQIHTHAIEKGLDLCPPELGPQLRLQYLTQKVGEYLLIGMNPLRTASGSDTCFVVGNGGAGLLLIGRLAASDLTVSSQSQFVFARRR